MTRAFAPVWAAFAYFSILPVPGAAGTAAPGPATLVALPIVGAVVGALAGGVAFGLSFVAPPALVTAVAFALSIVLTGAIHVDGFLDSSDALFATAAPARRLEILKDPHHGTYAVAAMAVISAVWLAALWSLPPASLPATMAFAAALARAAAVTNAFVTPHARPGAAPAALAAPPAAFGLAAVLAALLAASFALSPEVAPLLVFALPVAALAVGRIAARRLGGGLTGDVYGFLIVLGEVVVLAFR